MYILIREFQKLNWEEPRHKARFGLALLIFIQDFCALH